jgi:hypothetical protein
MTKERQKNTALTMAAMYFNDRIAELNEAIRNDDETNAVALRAERREAIFAYQQMCEAQAA